MNSLDRRDALKSIAAMFGAGLLAPLARAVAAGADPGFAPQTPVFTDAQRRLVAAMVERIIPETDTPGAVAAGVPDYIEMMLGEWYDEEGRETFLESLGTLEAYVRRVHGGAYADLDADTQDAVLTLAMGDRLDVGGRALFDHLKQLTLTGYYTSEIGMTQERVYLPVPGRYDGDYPYAEVGTLFSG